MKQVANKIDCVLEPVPMRLEDLEDEYDTLASEIREYGVEV